MTWVTGDKSSGFRTNWREGGRKTPIKHGLTRATKAEAIADGRAAAERLRLLKPSKGVALLTSPINDVLGRWRLSKLADKEISEARAKLVLSFFSAIQTDMGWTTIGEITLDGLDQWKIKKAGVGTDKPIRAVKGVVSWAERVLGIPVDRRIVLLKMRRNNKRRKQGELLTPEQIATALLTATRIGGFHVGVAYEHLAHYPCRGIDVSRCLVGDWNSATRIITYRNTKNGDDQQHRVHSQHAEKLTKIAEGRKPGEHLFLDPWLQPWRIKDDMAVGIRDWWRANIGEHCLPVGSWGINKLKKFAMTRTQVAAGGNTKLTMAMSGHRDPQTVERHYLEQNLTTQDELIEKLPYISSGSTPGSTEGKKWKDRERERGRKRRPAKDRKVLESA